MFQLASQYRKKLEPKWADTHALWDGPIPTPLSTYMCRYTCLYLKEKFLTDHSISAKIIIGRPVQSKNGTPEGMFGFCDNKGCWHDHAWLLIDNHILDITADQFGGEAVIWTSQKDYRYVANNNQIGHIDEFRKLYNRISNW